MLGLKLIHVSKRGPKPLLCLQLPTSWRSAYLKTRYELFFTIIWLIDWWFRKRFPRSNDNIQNGCPISYFIPPFWEFNYKDIRTVTLAFRFTFGIICDRIYSVKSRMVWWILYRYWFNQKINNGVKYMPYHRHSRILPSERQKCTALMFSLLMTE